SASTSCNSISVPMESLSERLNVSGMVPPSCKNGIKISICLGEGGNVLHFIFVFSHVKLVSSRASCGEEKG
ncbi:hypothetical protein, partial [Escherichia coli]|uniref:hypothetical protein n=1 Tax=Escherichia coli TaxID=562 RepID=UPI00227DE7A9